MSNAAFLGGYLSGKLAIDYISSVAGGAIDAATRAIAYESMAKWPHILPSPADLTEAYFSGMISEHNYSVLLRQNGISWKGNPPDDFAKTGDFAWQNVIASKMPRISLDQLFYLYYSGQITQERYNELAKYFKFNSNFISEFKLLQFPKFDLGTIMNLHFRGFVNDDNVRKAIRKFYGCSEIDADSIVKTQQYIPPPSDLLRYVVKDVFDENQIEILGLADEFDTVSGALPWAKALGIPENTVIKTPTGDKSLNVMRAEWISHWQLMAPTQGYTALHRLRPNRLFRYNQSIPGLKPFEFTQLNALLKSNDYVPEQRKWLAASSYNLLGRIDLRRVFMNGMMDEEELFQRYQDAGYAEVDAQLLTDYTVNEKDKKDKLDEEKKTKKAYAKRIQEVYASYEYGAISRNTAFNSLVTMKVEEEEANANLDAIDLRIQRKRVQSYIKMVKDEFFLGLYTGQEAYEQLIFGRVDDIRANQYVILWQRQLSRPRRVASTNVLLDWLKSGLINFEDASTRLTKLGFSNADTLLYLESAKMDIDKKIQMEQIAQQRTELQRTKEIKALFKEIQSNKRATQAQLRSYSPIPTMKRWYINDLISWPDVYERMQFLDIPLTDINKYKEEWDNEKAS
jgi:hypothetical protein